jgi:hypothetical protein|tara:strand:+ start:59 stop:646 length:588 start_codon:yes stop_codon:yes gene_type:complete
MARSKCPKGTICIENYTVLFICLLLLVIGYFVYKHHFCLSCSHIDLNTTTHSPSLPPTMFNIASNSGYEMLRPIARPGLSYNKNPTDTLLNPYSPPTQHNNPHTYKQIGYLKNEEHGNKLFPIFAKPVHLRRDKWYYYTIFDNIKLPIYSNGRKCSSEHGCDSLMNGDSVQLENMNNIFHVSMYDNHTLTYDPVI